MRAFLEARLKKPGPKVDLIPDLLRKDADPYTACTYLAEKKLSREGREFLGRHWGSSIYTTTNRRNAKTLLAHYQALPDEISDRAVDQGRAVALSETAYGKVLKSLGLPL